eukprot:2127273-Pleurochrysis_carterae.AAC.1
MEGATASTATSYMTIINSMHDLGIGSNYAPLAACISCQSRVVTWAVLLSMTLYMYAPAFYMHGPVAAA